MMNTTFRSHEYYTLGQTLRRLSLAALGITAMLATAIWHYEGNNIQERISDALFYVEKV